MKKSDLPGYGTSMSDFLRPKEGVHLILILSSVVEAMKQVGVVLGDVGKRKNALYASTRKKFRDVVNELLTGHDQLLAHELEYECSEGRWRNQASSELCELAGGLPHLFERTREAIDAIGEDVVGEPFDSQLGIAMRELDCALILLKACERELETREKSQARSAGTNFDEAV